MKVYELKVKVYLRKTLQFSQLPEKISKYVTMYLAKNEKYLALHQSKRYKPYVLDYLYPIEKDGVYEKGKIYSFRIRTINQKLANYMLSGLDEFSNDEFKSLEIEIKTIPRKHLKRLFSITPVLIKNDEGYWKGKMDLDIYEKRIYENLIKKYKYFIKDLKEEVVFYRSLKVLNNTPCKIAYKDIDLLGDKLEFEIKDDKISQDLAYLALGVGLGEGTSFSCGFLGYKYL